MIELPESIHKEIKNLSSQGDLLSTCLLGIDGGSVWPEALDTRSIN